MLGIVNCEGVIELRVAALKGGFRIRVPGGFIGFNKPDIDSSLVSSPG